MSRDLKFGVAFRGRGLQRLTRDVRAVSGDIRSTGATARMASGGVASLTRSLRSATGRIAGYGEAWCRAAVHTRGGARALDAARRSAARYQSVVAGGVLRGAVRGGVGMLAGLGVLRSGGQLVSESVALNARLTRLMTNARGGRHWIEGVWESAVAASQRHGTQVEGILETKPWTRTSAEPRPDVAPRAAHSIHSSSSSGASSGVA